MAVIGYLHAPAASPPPNSVEYSSVLLQPESWKVLKECRENGVGIRLGNPVTQRLLSVQEYEKIIYIRTTVAAANVLAAGIFH